VIDGAALTPCPSPLAKSTLGEGSFLSYSRRKLESSPLPERFLRGERGRG